LVTVWSLLRARWVGIIISRFSKDYICSIFCIFSHDHSRSFNELYGSYADSTTLFIRSCMSFFPILLYLYYFYGGFDPGFVRCFGPVLVKKSDRGVWFWCFFLFVMWRCYSTPFAIMWMDKQDIKPTGWDGRTVELDTK